MNKVYKNKNKRLKTKVKSKDKAAIILLFDLCCKAKAAFFFIPYCRPHYVRITKHGTHTGIGET